MLAGDFFFITTLQQESGKISAALEINAGHKIFEGHFPGQPVVPGVCMMQMVKEILEAVLEQPLRLYTADNLKFLTVIDPVETNAIHATLKYTIAADESIQVAATFLNDSVVYFKMNGVFRNEKMPA